MGDATITYFPCGNGDTTLITLHEGTTLLIDCRIRDCEEDTDGNAIFDVHKYLLQATKKRSDGNHHLDVFLLTHHDEDHCLGFERCFYVGDPTNYSDDDRKAGKIIIDELWFAPRLLHREKKCDDAKVFRKEAKRRTDLFLDNETEAKKHGNRCCVVGHSDDDSMEGLEAIRVTPGSTVNTFNKKAFEEFRVHFLSPLKSDTDGDDCDRNDASIVFFAKFDADDVAEAVIAFFGGDAGCCILKRIYNTYDDERLAFDLYLTTHHCSWYAFSETSHSEGGTADEEVTKLLKCRRAGAQVIASSKPIVDDDDDPPSAEAAKHYEKAVGAKAFTCLGEYPSKESPRPLIFSVTDAGPVREEPPKVEVAKALDSVVRTPMTYGK